MGGDGGSIPKREELVKSKRKQERANKEDANSARWHHCALSQDPLRQPIVACQLGRLYNKEAIITKLLAKKNKNLPTQQSGVADHINKLRDVCKLNLIPTTARQCTSSKTESNNGSVETSTETFYCPVTGLEMSGHHQFIFLWTCGCLFSKKAIDTIEDSRCMQCMTPFELSDVVLLNPQSDAEISAAQCRLKAFQSANQTKTKKRPQPSSSLESKNAVDQDGPFKRPHMTDTTNQTTKQQVNADVTANDDSNTNVSSSSSSKSIQLDPSTSSVYKSLFTTSEQAKRQPKGHWVTYNPLYFR